MGSSKGCVGAGQVKDVGIHSRANRYHSRDINKRHLAGGVCSEQAPDKEEDVEVVPRN